MTDIATKDRLDLLELQLKWWKRVVAVLGIAVAALAGMVVVLFTSRDPFVRKPMSFAAAPNLGQPKTVTAQGFVLVDEGGKVLATLSRESDGTPALSLFDRRHKDWPVPRKDKPLARLSISDLGHGTLDLHDEGGWHTDLDTSEFQFQESPTSTRALKGPLNPGSMELGRFWLKVGLFGAEMWLSSPGGQTVKFSANDPSPLVPGDNEATSSIRFGQDFENDPTHLPAPDWRAPSAYLYSSNTRGSGIELYDRHGRVIWRAPRQ